MASGETLLQICAYQISSATLKNLPLEILSKFYGKIFGAFSLGQ
jgi:hypothetical protein